MIDDLYDLIDFVDWNYYQNSLPIAQEHMRDIDPKDVEFVALAHYFDCVLWTNDKKLLEHVTLVKTINTDQLLLQL